MGPRPVRHSTASRNQHDVVSTAVMKRQAGTLGEFSVCMFLVPFILVFPSLRIAPSKINGFVVLELIIPRISLLLCMMFQPASGSSFLSKVSPMNFTNSDIAPFSSSPRFPSLSPFSIFIASASPFFCVHRGGSLYPPNFPPLPLPLSPLPRPRPRSALPRMPPRNGRRCSSGSGSIVVAYIRCKADSRLGCVLSNSSYFGLDASTEKSVFCLRYFGTGGGGGGCGISGDSGRVVEDRVLPSS